jgi:hypothetical protein
MKEPRNCGQVDKGTQSQSGRIHTNITRGKAESNKQRNGVRHDRSDFLSFLCLPLPDSAKIDPSYPALYACDPEQGIDVGSGESSRS